MDTLEANIRLMNDKMLLSSSSPGRSEIITDYLPPYGEGGGYFPSELFLISFGTCAGGTILSLLRRFGRQIDAYSIKMQGELRAEHPKSFSKIIMEVWVTSRDANMEDCGKASLLAEKKYCPLWAMIRGNVQVETVFHVNGASAEIPE
jgi:Predicted redox protein, regulator of disulfide bond formation